MFEKIKQWLEAEGIDFRVVHHAPTHTSEESAAARGESLAVGGKAIVIKVDEGFKLFVLSASLKVDSSKIKARFGAKKLRFASAEELLELTGLVPGSVPPLGPPILTLDLFVDESIVRNDSIAFNAGSLTDSIIMTTKDYLRVAKPEVFAFSKSE
ncbi:MAG TPA: YbaK/EbsC family protein [Bacteroidota bacterium]|nr:YbaK/EbsC family protein [Bacteroidota bacterium]